MATFVLVPGAGGGTWFWHRLIPELENRGHTAIAVDLPTGDENAGLAEYADTIVATAKGHEPVVLVAQSMGGYSAPMACDRLDVSLLVLVNPMVPVPGESPGEYWAGTDQPRAAADYALARGRSTEFDLIETFFHDTQADKPFEEPWPLTAWPDVPIRVVQGRDDRLFPLTFQQRVVKERLGIDVDEVPGGHLGALSYPVELAERLVAYVD
jgi:pimeloyl-ACP methyl ester carboxylesterase